MKNFGLWIIILLGLTAGCSSDLQTLPDQPTDEVESASVMWSNFGYQAGWSSQFSQPSNPSTGFYPVQQIGTSNSPGKPTHKGPTSLRMEVRSNEARDAAGGFHAQLGQNGVGGLGQTRFYGFATHFPSGGAVEGLTFFQLFNPGGQNKPMVMMYVNGSGQVGFKVIKNIADDGDDTWVNVGNVGFGRFETFVVGVKWSNGSDGWIKVWLNNGNEGSPTATYTGRTCNSDCNSSLSTRLILGAYMPRWTKNPPSSAEKRWVYHDTVRVATTFGEARP